ncbi:hypothetical protein PV08_06818 [Exophiala spinifera]|uniref:Uncharacterized protein n=1 Tax=Exophiala spinifera TaxID=91928 RepID=A0A0D1ZML7_9EURO|nr:uncharacterized protein PV08_06818 [Exophiala spinifera]KIW14037.1 hypothetical protein PV08_06818 [Exophiala spinifera]
MAEPDEVEEDLFADLYDGDENAAAAGTAPVPSQPLATDTPMKQNDVPGYGEEPETAYDPAAFDADNSAFEEPQSSFKQDPQEQEKAEPSQEQKYNVTLKEDG